LQHSLNKCFIASLIALINDLILFCDKVEHLLRDWHEKTMLKGSDLKELQHLVNKLRNDLSRLSLEVFHGDDENLVRQGKETLLLQNR